MNSLYLDYISKVILYNTSARVFFTAIFFTLVLSICLALKDRHPRLQMLLWILVLVRAIAPTDWQSSISLRYLLDFSSITTQSWEYWCHSAWLWAHDILGTPILINLPHATWAMLLVAIWPCISLYLLASLFKKRYYFSQLISQSRQIHCARFNRQVEDMQLKRKVDFFVGRTQVSPFTIGCVKPKIYLPQVMIDELDQQSLRAIVAHELAHVQRFDDLWGLLRQYLHCCFFFFPLINFTNKQIDEQKEIASDRLALINSNISVGGYATAMLRCIKQFQGFTKPNVPALSLSRGSYHARLIALKHYSIPNLSNSIVYLAVVLFMLICVMPMASQQAQASNVREYGKQIIPWNLTKLSSPVPEGEIVEVFNDIELDAPLGLGKVLVLHDGIDIKLPVGSAIFAMADGLVEKVIDQPLDGNAYTGGGYVQINHNNGVQAIYRYVNQSPLKTNQKIQKGDLVGYLLAVSYSPRDKSKQQRIPAHLHIATRYQQTVVDPLLVIEFSPLLQNSTAFSI